MNDKNCIFCKIAKGDIPSYSVYEDDNTLAFLDIHPVSKGHVLVIAKKHYETVDDMPEDEYLELMKVVHSISQKMRQEYKVDRIARANIGLDVDHVHIHLIPIYVGGEIKLSQDLESEVDHTNLSIVANSLKIADLKDELDKEDS